MYQMPWCCTSHYLKPGQLQLVCQPHHLWSTC
jgi:hypothetical protein